MASSALRVLALLAGPVFASGGGATARGPCYRRRNVNLAKCTHTGANAQFTLYTLQRSGQKGESWAKHVRTNCCCGSDRYGADNILPEPFAAWLPLASCQHACSADANCTAVVWRSAPAPPPPPPPQPPVPPGAFDWIREIEASPGGRTVRLEAKTYLIDRQYQLPRGTELRGAGTALDKRTIIRAVGSPYTACAGTASAAGAVQGRKGLLLGDDTVVSGLHMVGMETTRLDCLYPPKDSSLVLCVRSANGFGWAGTQ